MFKFAFIFFIFSSRASAFDSNVIEKRFSDAAVKYNEAETSDIRANCWGTLLNITGLTEDLSISDYAPVLGFFQSKHCKQVVPRDSGDFFTHIDGSDGAYHSYYVGPDSNAWQKFDPSSYSLIKKESHEEILAWYQLLAKFNDSNFQYTYYSCDKPKGSFLDVLQVYKDRDSESIESVLKLIELKLLESDSDSGELFLLLYTLEHIAHKGSGYSGLFNTTKELKPYESVITKVLLRLVSSITTENQDLLNSILSFYINPQVLIKSLEKIVEIGGARNISKTNLELVLHRISLFIGDDRKIQQIYESDTFASFTDSLLNLSPKNYGFLIKSYYLRLKEQKSTDSALLKWFDHIIEETAHLTSLNSEMHFIFHRLHLQGVKVPLQLQSEVNEDIYFENHFKLAPGHYFPNSYSEGWEDRFN